MNRLKYLLILIFIFPLISKSQDYCKFIQNIQNYQDCVKLKSKGDYDIIDLKTFDIHNYLSFFNNIEIEDGIRIDIYYFDNFLDGNPYLYALPNKQKLDDKNLKTLYKFLNQIESRAKNHIIPKDSENGYFQYLFFAEMGEQFALKWHANYKRKYIICSKNKLDEIVNEFRTYNKEVTNKDTVMEAPDYSVDLKELSNLAQLNPTIDIEMTNDYCTVSWIENRTHSGIYRCTYQIQRQSPYKIDMIKEEILLNITIGFLY